ncbi:MAG: hypothetical protein H6818_02675 [Phycisphaerales bacterium]|nr:hypothetical protein [Phycisphaerales bacterium]MCB9863220.1 hypothetical protein [Phycisphaerales bacterium]
MPSSRSSGPESPVDGHRKSRIRSHHLYVLLALFDVVVIMFSLLLHSRTIEDANRVTDAASSLDAQLRWLQTAQQRVVELNAPGNDLFRAEQPEEYESLRRRFNSAKSNMAALFKSENEHAFSLSDLQPDVDSMTRAAEGLFEEFQPMAAAPMTAEARQAILLKAGPLMATMDEQQHKALWILGGLVTQQSEKKNLLLQEHESRLHSTAVYQRVFIAAVIAILVGVLIFGRRLQASDRALEEQRRLLAQERQDRLAAIGELCSSVAHGIRNPLASICSSVELALEAPDLNERTAKRLRDTLREGERLGDRVRGLLDVARMNRAVRDRISIGDAARQAARELETEIEKLGVTLTLGLPKRPVFVDGDHKNIELALIELLSNAMEHTPQGGTIRFDCGLDATGRYVAIVVEDSGPGVPKAVRRRVFDLFFTTKAGGTGIGLASVKRIAQIHGGDIELAEGESGGAKFVLTLPIAETQTVAPAERRPTPADRIG